MLKVAKNTQTTRYISGNFYVDIIETNAGFEAWLSRRNGARAQRITTAELNEYADAQSFIESITPDLSFYKNWFEKLIPIWKEGKA